MPIGLKRKALARRVRKVKAKTSAPRAKAAPAPKAASRPVSRYVLRNGRLKRPMTSPLSIHARHDAETSGHRPLPMPYAATKCNIMNGLSRMSVPTSAGGTIIILCMWTPGAIRLCYFWHDNGAMLGVNGDAISCYNTETPESLRHMRQTLKIRNVTRADQVAGVVRFLSATEWPNLAAQDGTVNGPLKPTIASFNNVVAWIRQNTATTTKTAAELRATMSFPIPPGHNVAHQTYQTWTNTPVNGNEYATLFNTIGKLEPTLPLFILIEPCNAAQAYDVAVHVQDACQYEARSALNLIAYTPPGTSQQKWDHQKKVLEHLAKNGDYSAAIKKYKEDYIVKTKLEAS